MSVGKALPRTDAAEKLTGKARYIDDIDFPGQLYGGVVRSPHPCARVAGISHDEGFDFSDVVTFTADEIAGKNVFNLFNMDAPFLPIDGKVNFIGEPVLLVAAPTREKLREAKKHIRVQYEKLPATLTVEDSVAGKTLIYGSDNVQKSFEVNKGDVQEGFGNAAHIVEGEYRTGYQEHVYIETQGVIAVPDEDGEGVTIYGSFQCPYYIRKESQMLFPFAPEKIRAVQVVTGGAFGGKEHYPSYPAGHAALLALKAGKPVKMIFERSEDIECTTKRHPSVVRHRTGIDGEGRITAMEVDVTFDGGAYGMASPVVLARGTIAACGAYNCPNVKVRARVMATNKVPTSAFRGFGAPQVFFAVELHMEKVAEAAGLDPYAFRLRNVLREGDITATSQLLRYSVAGSACLEAVVKKSDFLQRREEYGRQPRDAKTRRGIGLCLVFHGAGFTGMGENFIKGKAGIELLPGGGARILCGTTEMGQGMRTVLPQIAASALQIPVEEISVERTDTSLVPDSGPTVASRTTMIVGKVLVDAATLLIDALGAFLAAGRGAQREEISYREGAFSREGKTIASFNEAAAAFLQKGNAPAFYSQYAHPPFIQWDQDRFVGDAYAAYAWAATVVEVEVDMQTFQTTVLKVVTAEDMGRAVNPVLCEGQIEGGIMQGLGYALTEEMTLAEGRILNNSFSTYIIPTSREAPPIETVLVEEAYPHGPFGAKGLGEMPLVATAPAVAAAVRQATGLDVDEIPITPEKLFAKAGEAPGGRRE